MDASRDPYLHGERLDPAAHDGWSLSLPIVVRFADVDAFNHVNNAVYLSYCEMGRVAYFQAAAALQGPRQTQFILARAEVDFRRPVELGDALRVLVRAEHIGTKSFRLAYRLLVTQQGVEHVACESISVQVAFDYAENSSIPVPPHIITSLEAFEGRRLRD
ncbi:MAG TPA: thioesterase family protein [Chloroflexia bacterium]|nr:thioesterase family protein [Chloroflexia bacterium]